MANDATHDDRTICPGCKREIDPDICGCGDDEKHHNIGSGHFFVPMGCACYYANANESEDAFDG